MTIIRCVGVFITVYASEVGGKSGCMHGTWVDNVFESERQEAPDTAVKMLWSVFVYELHTSIGAGRLEVLI